MFGAFIGFCIFCSYIVVLVLGLMAEHQSRRKEPGAGCLAASLGIILALFASILLAATNPSLWR